MLGGIKIPEKAPKLETPAPGIETPAPTIETPAPEIETPAPEESDANKNVIVEESANNNTTKELQSVMQGFKFTKCTVNINLSK